MFTRSLLDTTVSIQRLASSQRRWWLQVGAILSCEDEAVSEEGSEVIKCVNRVRNALDTDKDGQ